MSDIKFTIPVIGKLFSYIKDFLTDKKHWNLQINFRNTKQDDKVNYFDLLLKNTTSYCIKIKEIYVRNGDLKIGYYANEGYGRPILKYRNINNNNINKLLYKGESEKMKLAIKRYHSVDISALSLKMKLNINAVPR